MKSARNIPAKETRLNNKIIRVNDLTTQAEMNARARGLAPRVEETEAKPAKKAAPKAARAEAAPATEAAAEKPAAKKAPAKKAATKAKPASTDEA